MSEITDAVRGLADDIAGLKAKLLPVALGAEAAALLASIEERVARFPIREVEAPTKTSKSSKES